MYLVYVIVLMVGVYAAPALAIWPDLYRRPLGASVMPLLSVGIVVVAAALLAAAGLLNPPMVMAVSGAWTLVAVLRLVARRGSLGHRWSAQEIWIALIIVAVCLPLSVRLGFTSFAANDEIYSWNLWAIQWFRGESPDFYYTAVPYPQAFSLLLAWGYALLGNLELQLPLRFTLGLFPMAMCLAVAACAPGQPLDRVSRFVLLLLVWLFMTSSKSHLDNGLADPMMTAALIGSMALYLQRRRGRGARGVVPLVLLACLAAMTKQAALIWTCFALPVLLLVDEPRRARTWASVLLLIGVPVGWMLSAGYGFWDNQGVIETSLKGRGALDQVLHSVDRYLVSKPGIALMLIAAAFGVRGDSVLQRIFWLAAVPMLAAWFAFGAYDMRLGLHVVATLALLIAAGDYRFVLFDWPERGWSAAATFIWRRRRLVLGLFAVLSLITCALIIRPRIDGPFGPSLLHGGKHTVAEHFGEQAPWVMDELYGRDDRLVWAPSNYVYGIFYGHTPVMRPDYGDSRSYSLDDFVAELLDRKPHVVIDSTERLAQGNAWSRLQEALKRCPAGFEPVGEAAGKHGFRLFLVHHLELDACALAWLASNDEEKRKRAEKGSGSI